MRTRNAMQLKAQIRNKAKDVGTTPQLMMQNYLLERILERISLSHWRDNVVINIARHCHCIPRLPGTT